jgi:hypothetical protein
LNLDCSIVDDDMAAAVSASTGLVVDSEEAASMLHAVAMR